MPHGEHAHPIRLLRLIEGFLGAGEQIAPARRSMLAVATAADNAPLFEPSTHVCAYGHCAFVQSTAACKSITWQSDIRHSRFITG